MQNDIIRVREYALLTTVPGFSEMDKYSIPQSVYDWLLEEQGKFYKNGVPIVSAQGKNAIKLGSHVGLLQTPCGKKIEILPKTSITPPTENELRRGRKKLCEMISSYIGRGERKYGPADLELFDWPISEFILREFLKELQSLVQKGMRHIYLRVNEESRYLRGQLRIADQVRQPLSKSHYFQIHHDIFTVNRPENRLLRKALEIAASLTKNQENWRISNELLHQTHDIPTSINIKEDFTKWSNDRLMESYKNIKPWTELILNKLNPTSQLGKHTGIALLFPMEYLFEDYVTQQLSRRCCPGWHVKSQASSRYLCDDYKGRPIFQLKPDILLRHRTSGDSHILDTKWKLLDVTANSTKDKNGLSQSDFYQLFAYGQKYMAGKGDMMLIYPAYEKFNNPLPVFNFDDQLRLWVVPFDLYQRKILLNDITHNFAIN